MEATIEQQNFEEKTLEKQTFEMLIAYFINKQQDLCNLNPMSF